MMFSPNKIDLGNSSIALNVEDGLPQININANGITVSIGPHPDLTFDTIKKLGNDLIKFANEGCSASSKNIELIYSYIDIISGKRVFRTKNGDETEIWHNAEPCKLDDIEPIKEIKKYYDPKFYIPISFFYRTIGDVNKYFDVVNGSLIYTNVDIGKLKELKVIDNLKKEVEKQDAKKWIVRSCPITKLIECEI